jgi:hypothetical protein
MAIGLLGLLAGCAGELGGTAPDVAAPAECDFHPEAGDFITPCTNAAGQWIEHDGARCVLAHRNGSTGFGAAACVVTYSTGPNYAVSSCDDC